MNSINKWLKAKSYQLISIPLITKLFEHFFQIMVEKKALFGVSYWYEVNLWEPPVQLALRDLCKPGTVVFDVGANFGGLTMVMSRMVGPKGIVCAFEASPRVVDKCQRNIVLNGCSNVQVYHAAVYHTSNSIVTIYSGSHLGNDSIYPHATSETVTFNVTTLAIDDFVEFTGLVPDLVKMDIEGAEYDALQGMLKIIYTAKPHLILEQQPNDTRCLELLREQGYVAIDLNTYRQICSPDDYPVRVSIRNNLYIHQDKLSQSPYNLPFTFEETTILTTDEFIGFPNGSISLKNLLTLAKGRYLIEIDMSATGTNNEMMCGVKIGDKVIFRYHAYTEMLVNNYREWVFHLPEVSTITLYFDFLNNTQDSTFSVKGAKIYRILEFDHLTTQLYI